MSGLFGSFILMPGVSAQQVVFSSEHTQTETGDNISRIFTDLLNNTIGLIPKFLEVIVNLLLSPLKALGQIWESWGGSVAGGGLFAPFLAVFVIMLIVVMIRVYASFDQAGDKATDLLNPGDE